MIRRTILTSQGAPKMQRRASAAFPTTFWSPGSAFAAPTRWATPVPPRATSELPVDVVTTNDQAIIRAALPGVDAEHLEVSVYRDTVSIAAQLPAMPTPEGEGATWLVSELGRGAFKRTIRLPFQIEEGSVVAEYSNGLLQLTLPKVEAEKPRRISVQVRSDPSYELEAGERHQDETFAAD